MIVTLCGSVRFEKEFKIADLELARRGITCFTLVVFPSDGVDVSTRGQPLEESGYDKIMLDLGYLRKIAASDAILVLGDGYIGKSTAREIMWAVMLGKRVYATQFFDSDWDVRASLMQLYKGEDDHTYLLMSRSKDRLKE